MWRLTYTPKILNWACFALGMGMLWHLTQDWWVMLWGFVASLHFTFDISPREAK